MWYYGGPASLVNASCYAHENCEVDYFVDEIKLMKERELDVGEIVMSRYAQEPVDLGYAALCAVNAEVDTVGCDEHVSK